MQGWEIHSAICVPKIINVDRGLTESYRVNKKGAVFFAPQGIKRELSHKLGALGFRPFGMGGGLTPKRSSLPVCQIWSFFVNGCTHK